MVRLSIDYVNGIKGQKRKFTCFLEMSCYDVVHICIKEAWNSIPYIMIISVQCCIKTPLSLLKQSPTIRRVPRFIQIITKISVSYASLRLCLESIRIA